MTTNPTELHPIFQDCCGKGIAFDFSKPFRRGAHLYATDGKIAVRRVLGEAERMCWHDTSDFSNPPAEKLPWWDTPHTNPLPVPDVGPEPTPVPCEECKGTGKYDGVGECESCEGSGTEWPGWKPIRLIDGVQCVNDAWLRILHKHGAVLYPPKGEGCPFAFTVGDDIEGLMMTTTAVPA